MWIILSILAGLGDALRDAFSKKASASLPRPLITWSYSLCALPFLVPSMVAHIPEAIPSVFWYILPCTALLHVWGGLMLVKALHLSDLSLCTPMVAFTPVLLLVVGPLITGDMPSAYGIVGAMLVAAGSYTLNVGQAKRGFFAPIRALLNERGSRIMLALAILWSVTGSIDRVMVQKIDPNFWGGSQVCLIAILLAPIVLRHDGVSASVTRRSAGALLLLGGCNVLSLITYLIAMQYAPVHYVICLKRSSILFSVLLGRLLFNESLLKDRLPGAILMLIGVIIISIFS